MTDGFRFWRFLKGNCIDSQNRQDDNEIAAGSGGMTSNEIQKNKTDIENWMTNSFIGQVGDVTNHKQDFEKLHVFCEFFYLCLLAQWMGIWAEEEVEGQGLNWKGRTDG